MNLSWRGYRLIAADVSGMRLPSSGEIVSEFEPNGTTGTIGNLFVDLCTSLICSARLAAWNIGEQTLAEEQLPEVITQMRSLNQKKLLFIYDRGYPSVKFIQQHYDLEVDFIFRLQKRNYSKLWERWRIRF